MNIVLFMFTLSQLATGKDTFYGISFTNIVTIATHSNVFIKKSSRSVARQPK